MKSRVFKDFKCRIVDRAIRVKDDAGWLDFGKRKVDWRLWELQFYSTKKRRADRGTLGIRDSRAETLVVLTEAIVNYIDLSRSYFGSVELQLVVHSMLMRGPSCLTLFYDSVWEILRAHLGKRRYRMVAVIREVLKHLEYGKSPISEDGQLQYPVGTTFGSSLL